jgi:hypothetical protein
MKTETGRTMTMDRVKASLVQLGCSNQMLYEYIIGTPTSLYLMLDYFLWHKINRHLYLVNYAKKKKKRNSNLFLVYGYFNML